METLAASVYAIRRFGALALDLAYCACGRFDVVVSKGFKWWDVAAGMLLVSQADGAVVCLDGEELSPADSFCVASNKVISKSVLGVVSKLD